MSSSRSGRLCLVAALLLISQAGAGGVAAQGSDGTNRANQLGKPYVVLISFDGFAATYLDRFDAPNFQRVARNGVRAEALIPVFPSKTFPNHYSIVTGLYPETHGLVGNRFYDPVRKDRYSIGDNKAVTDGSWYGGEPIWATAEKQGMVSASFFWVGSEARISGVRPSEWKAYSWSDSFPALKRTDSVIAWLQKPAAARPHMITLYLSNVDGAGHEGGAASPEVERAIHVVDAALGRLLDAIEQLPYRDSVYVILVSDHGMANSVPENGIAIESLIDTAGVLVAEGGPVANLHVTGGARRARAIRDSINARLSHGRAYLRQEVPERFRYRNSPRIGDVVVVMNEHYVIGLRRGLPKKAGGHHGWDPALRSMHAIFLALGPGIPAGGRIPAFENVHIYPFIADALGLQPAAGVEGRAGFLRGLIAGDTLPPFPLADETRSRYERQLAEARAAYERAPNNADSIIWLGRRLAYLGRVREAIGVYSRGIDLYPDNPWLYRHRGHRYITLRELDRAIEDLRTAAKLVEGKPDEIEPDGQPNALNRPTGTLQSNIDYHLALAYYLKGDFRSALPIYRRELAQAANPDRVVSIIHWYYMALRRLGRAAEAAALLGPIKREMDVIENGAYHRLLLMYKGELSPDSVVSAGAAGAMSVTDATAAYGLGNWHLYNGRPGEAEVIFRRIIAGGQWPAFGYIAAEAELARKAP